MDLGLTVSEITKASRLDSLILLVTVYLQSAAAFLFKGKSGRDMAERISVQICLPALQKTLNKLRMCSLRLIWRWFLLPGMRDKQTEAPVHVEIRLNP